MDYTLQLFKYFSKFVPKAVLSEQFKQPQHSLKAGYAEIQSDILSTPDNSVIADVSRFICSANTKYVEDSVRNAKGLILFVEYGEKMFNPVVGEFGLSRNIAITVASEVNMSNNDNLNEAMVINLCENVLDRILLSLSDDQRNELGCSTIGRFEFPANISPIDAESFFGRGGWTAMLTIKNTVCH